MSGLLDIHTLFALVTAVAVIASILSVALPLLEKNELSGRMKQVAIEREKIRARERAKLAQNIGGKSERISLRQEPKALVMQIVDRFNMRDAFADKATRNRLKQAGFRSEAHLMTFTFARIAGPIAGLLLALFYLFFLAKLDQPPFMKIFMAFCFAYACYYAPILYLKNLSDKRKQSINRAWPDALDLFLICVESGMTAELGFQKVASEIGSSSVELAEELTLLTAELSYLQERKIAYENLSDRTGLEGVRGVMTSLIQAERYGTPLGDAIRVMADENRTARMSAAEKKAAALPPKLTVPMILFFLPAIFVVVLGPAALSFFAK
ncbi:type II secretion system F family protein [Cohaesibacter gelatinilyticus]|uniref:Tight adherence protein C n=1 Tax=Cohaesibacter gelatinilyticus TaxID=372072 RepID=A0A285PKU8_9HYPH|nr:type II secretion system F family protein [Cohaesibacter gelatinilyticus]SNZ20716.1 tight adherence protein C [Cohaesibacter gelatinilyticus]HAT86916.1 type II secretion system F family protein [Hyphomicrobiales bacterium]